MYTQYEFEVMTLGRGFTRITDEITKQVRKAKISVGLCHIFLHHTSASLILCENYDPLVQTDLEAFMQRLVPDSDTLYKHAAEGPDDMPSHIRAILTQSFLIVPIKDNQLVLGQWQGIYLWEHRFRSHHRTITVTIQG
ncbi:MAG: secondary thiamine-phosphate synthase enzyme YjbQ [Gammaproteobacteria bacterium]|nr:secondary thiamine-phosphate synthase enzyme YjbQ [Gammaproteobacteria bacterium]MCW5583238.1 secondary thiamine-phosphate synthase enzyme YjbQ [Gammaproteobacteria bacterium]